MNLCHRCILIKGALSFFKCPSGYMTFLKRQVFKCASYTQLPSSDSVVESLKYAYGKKESQPLSGKTGMLTKSGRMWFRALWRLEGKL